MTAIFFKNWTRTSRPRHHRLSSPPVRPACWCWPSHAPRPQTYSVSRHCSLRPPRLFGPPAPSHTRLVSTLRSAAMSHDLVNDRMPYLENSKSYLCFPRRKQDSHGTIWLLQIVHPNLCFPRAVPICWVSLAHQLCWPMFQICQAWNSIIVSPTQSSSCESIVFVIVFTSRFDWMQLCQINYTARKSSDDFWC